MRIEAVRLFGDLVVSAFFEGRKHKDRELRRSAYAALVADGQAEGRRDEIDDRRSADPPLRAPALGDRVSGGVRTGSVRRDAGGAHGSRGRPRLRCAGGESAVRGEEHRGGRQRRRLPRLAQGGARGEPRQRRPRGALLPAGVHPRARRRHVRADRDEHHRPGRHALHRAALDLHARRARSTTPGGDSGGPVRQPWW